VQDDVADESGVVRDEVVLADELDTPLADGE
jgi:hypothetical protein